jgi:hypothetical protein
MPVPDRFVQTAKRIPVARTGTPCWFRGSHSSSSAFCIGLMLSVHSGTERQTPYEDSQKESSNQFPGHGLGERQECARCDKRATNVRQTPHKSPPFRPPSDGGSVGKTVHHLKHGPDGATEMGVAQERDIRKESRAPGPRSGSVSGRITSRAFNPATARTGGRWITTTTTTTAQPHQGAARQIEPVAP